MKKTSTKLAALGAVQQPVVKRKADPHHAAEKKLSFREHMELHAVNKQIRQNRREHAYQDDVTEKINRNPGEKRYH